MIEFGGRGILLDIEGTTSSVSYVYDVLFPYVRRKLDAFLAERWNDDGVTLARQQIAQDAGATNFAMWVGLGQDPEASRAKLCGEVLRLMDEDAKTTGLKELQGLIWQEGYDAGELKSHVFPDVPVALRAWRNAGVEVGIFSSGSVTAQRAFFKHTEYGDLSELISSHYDTTIGPKRSPYSYEAIADDMRLPASAMLFLSDVTAELDAAREAGMNTGLVERPGNAPQPAGHGHSVIRDLLEIALG